jgi:hypothetical protein
VNLDTFINEVSSQFKSKDQALKKSSKDQKYDDEISLFGTDNEELNDKAKSNMLIKDVR